MRPLRTRPKAPHERVESTWMTPAAIFLCNGAGVLLFVLLGPSQNVAKRRDPDWDKSKSLTRKPKTDVGQHRRVFTGHHVLTHRQSTLMRPNESEEHWQWNHLEGSILLVLHFDWKFVERFRGHSEGSEDCIWRGFEMFSEVSLIFWMPLFQPSRSWKSRLAHLTNMFAKMLGLQQISRQMGLNEVPPWGRFQGEVFSTGGFLVDQKATYLPGSCLLFDSCFNSQRAYLGRFKTSKRGQRISRKAPR